MNDIATSSGLDTLRRLNAQIWSASELSQKTCRAIFDPLLKQLYHLMEYVIKRIPSIVDNVMETRANRSIAKKTEFVPAISMRNYPQFVWYLHDLFEEYVEELSKIAFDKCKDELAATQIVIWQMDAKKKANDIMKKMNKGKEAGKNYQQFVESLAHQLFKDQQNRIISNILLKTYDFLFVKLQKSVAGVIQGKMTLLPDERLAAMFDLEATVRRLKDEEENLSILSKVDLEATLMESASKFRI